MKDKESSFQAELERLRERLLSPDLTERDIEVLIEFLETLVLGFNSIMETIAGIAEEGLRATDGCSEAAMSFAAILSYIDELQKEKGECK